MCDYSLAGIPNRLAGEGEELVLHRFRTGSRGFASPTDLRINAQQLIDNFSVFQLWLLIKNRWRLLLQESPPAVCVPPGARLLLRDIPRQLQQQLAVGTAETVSFVQLSATAYRYRDSVRFRNGREVLLQKLPEGLRLKVLCLSLPECEVIEKDVRNDIEMRVRA